MMMATRRSICNGYNVQSALNETLFTQWKLQLWLWQTATMCHQHLTESTNSTV